MSTDWDSLLQDVEIIYSKLAGIDGLLVIDMVNYDDVDDMEKFSALLAKGLVIRGFDVALMGGWTWSWANNQVAVDFRRHDAHVMSL